MGRRALRMFLLVLVPAAMVFGGLWIYAETGRHIETENAYVKSHIIAVSTDVSGRVVAVDVTDHQAVVAGQPLFQIDPEPFEIAVAESQAQITLVKTRIETLRVDYHEARVELGEARERVRFLERQYERQRRLKEQGVTNEESFDEAAHELDMARRRVQAIQQRIQRVLARLGGDPEIPVEKHARYLRAVAVHDKAALDLERTHISAPTDGVVSNMKLQAGEYVEEGEPIFSLIESSRVWVEANLKETQLTHVAEGQQASIVVDAYPNVEWPAVVDTIAPATGAEFALLPPQNATGNWVKVVQRVPVLLRIDGEADATRLRAGMTAAVTIDTEHDRDLPTFARWILGKEGVPSGLRQALARSEDSD